MTIQTTNGSGWSMNSKSNDLQVFNITVQGASHVDQSKVCQDASLSYVDEKCAIAIVCDGHGTDECFRSDIGSQIASEIAKEVLIEIVDEVEKTNDITHLILRCKEDIVKKWSEEVFKHFTENMFTSEEVELLAEKSARYTVAYGSTLVAIMQTKNYCLGLQIGDGKCVFIDANGECRQPFPNDERCFLNETTSLCDEKALESFRHIFMTDVNNLPSAICAIFVGTDGVDGCFSNEEQLNKLYKTVLYSFGTTEFKKAVDELEEYLPRLSQKGSKDDISIAAIIDFNKLRNNENLLKY